MPNRRPPHRLRLESKSKTPAGLRLLLAHADAAPGAARGIVVTTGADHGHAKRKAFDVGRPHVDRVARLRSRALGEDALAFLGSYPTSYPQLRSVGEDRSSAFGATGVPENFLIDPHGRLALGRPSPVDERVLEEEFVPIIEGRQ